MSTYVAVFLLKIQNYDSVRAGVRCSVLKRCSNNVKLTRRGPDNVNNTVNNTALLVLVSNLRKEDQTGHDDVNNTVRQESDEGHCDQMSKHLRNTNTGEQVPHRRQTYI